jgi:glycine/D-amino acid oxidase-like deaminating enzyme
MDEQPTQPQAGDAVASAPQAGATGGTRAQASPQAGDDEVMTLAEARKLRAENASLRLRSKEAEAIELDVTARQKQLDDLLVRERDASKRAADMLALARQSAARAAVVEAASKVGIRPDLAAKLMASHAFEYDEHHQPRGVEKALREMVEAFPELVSGATAAANPAATRGNQPLARLKDAPSLSSSRLWTAPGQPS